MLSPFPNQGLHWPTSPQRWLGEAASQRGTMLTSGCLAVSSLCARLPLNCRPCQKSKSLPWRGHHSSQLLHPILAAVFCQILLSSGILFLSTYPQAAKQICIEWHSEVQTLFSVTSTISQGNPCQSFRMREVSCLSPLPCKPNLKLAEEEEAFCCFQWAWISITLNVTHNTF